MIVLRHGTKAYPNTAEHRYGLDPPLTEEGKTQALAFFVKLVSQYGPPTRLVCSPYQRTRETALAASTAILFECGVEITPEIDVELAEHLNSKWSSIYLNEETPLFRRETLKYGIVPPRDAHAFRRRVRTWARRTNFEANVWYITHGLFVRYLTEHYYPPMLGGVRHDPTTKEWNYIPELPDKPEDLDTPSYDSSLPIRSSR